MYKITTFNTWGEQRKKKRSPRRGTKKKKKKKREKQNRDWHLMQANSTNTYLDNVHVVFVYKLNIVM